MKRPVVRRTVAPGKSVTQILSLTPTGRATAMALRFNCEVLGALRRYRRALGVKLED